MSAIDYLLWSVLVIGVALVVGLTIFGLFEAIKEYRRGEKGFDNWQGRR